MMLVCLSAYSQEYTKEPVGNINITVIEYYGYKINITSNKDEFFTGRMEAVKNGKVQFFTDSSFSDYQWHYIGDLDGNGSNELLISVSEGASPYIYNDLYIFDIKKGIKPVYLITNADIDTTVKDEPKLNVYTRMSPSVLGLGYNWLMEYKYGKLSYFKADEKPWKNSVKPGELSILDNLNQYEDFSEKCSDGNYKLFFESLLIQSLIYGDDSKALKFIDKYYRCPDKKTAVNEIIDISAETYEYIIKEKNYRYE